MDEHRGIYHQNFNIEKPDKLLKEHGKAVKQAKWLDREQWFVLQATTPGVSVRALAKQYGLEELHDCLRRSWREIDEKSGRKLVDANSAGDEKRSVTNP